MLARVLKLGLAAVLLSTLAAPSAQGDGLSSLGLIIVIGSAAFVLVVTAAVTYAGVGLDYVIPDAPFKLAEENVDIFLSADRVSVSAEYVFQNDGKKDKELELSYPFGKGRGVGPAEDVAVTDGAGTEIPFERKNKNINFGFTVPAGSRTEVVVKYEQPVSGTTFTYLLGKDRFWGFGGAFTTFTVTAPAALGKVDSVYRLDKVAEDGDNTSYVYVRDKFYPTKNFTITWKKAAPATP